MFLINLIIGIFNVPELSVLQCFFFYKNTSWKHSSLEAIAKFLVFDGYENYGIRILSKLKQGGPITENATFDHQFSL